MYRKLRNYICAVFFTTHFHPVSFPLHSLTKFPSHLELIAQLTENPIATQVPSSVVFMSE